MHKFSKKISTVLIISFLISLSIFNISYAELDSTINQITTTSATILETMPTPSPNPLQIKSQESNTALSESVTQNIVPVPFVNLKYSPNGQYLIKLKNENAKAKIIEKIQKANGKILKEFRKITAICALLSNDEVDGLNKDYDVSSIEPDYVVKTESEETPWNVQQVNATVAHSFGIKGSGVNVAVFDTGISQHEELKISGGVSCVDGVESISDDNGHGTHVAGIISSVINDTGIIGVAPETNLYSVKVIKKDGSGSYSDIIEGIEWAIDNKINIINMSFGGSENSTILEDAVKLAYSNNILIFASAGNNGGSSTVDTIQYPAKYSEVIAVGAVDQNNNRASFSSTGYGIELMAPGVNINSTLNNGTYGLKSGTSMASPHAAAVAALIWSKDISLQNNIIRGLLDYSAKDIGDRSLYGNGLVDSSNALNLYDSYIKSAEKTKKENPKKSINKDVKEKSNTSNGNVQISGTEEAYYLDSPHPYSDYYYNSWVISKPGASNIRVHFSYIETESGYDYLSTSAGNSWNGFYYNTWSNWSGSNSITLTLSTDGSVTYNGFSIDKIEYIPNVSATPSISVDSVSTNSITVNAVFPYSGVSGNSIQYWSGGMQGCAVVNNNFNASNGSYTINNLTPGTSYVIYLVWFTDSTHQWEQQWITVNATTSAPPPPPGTYEAESSVNTFNNCYIFDDGNCSGGRYVGWIGGGRSLQFNNVYASTAGIYKITVSYRCGNRYTYCSVNNGEQSVIYYPFISNDWWVVGNYTFTVALNAGNNTLRFGNDSDWGVDIDKISINSIPEPIEGVTMYDRTSGGVCNFAIEDMNTMISQGWAVSGKGVYLYRLNDGESAEFGYDQVSEANNLGWVNGDFTQTLYYKLNGSPMVCRADALMDYMANGWLFEDEILMMYNQNTGEVAAFTANMVAQKVSEGWVVNGTGIYMSNAALDEICEFGQDQISQLQQLGWILENDMNISEESMNLNSTWTMPARPSITGTSKLDKQVKDIVDKLNDKAKYNADTYYKCCILQNVDLGAYKRFNTNGNIDKDKTIEAIAVDLKWNQDKIDKIWTKCNTILQETGTIIDPRLFLAIIKQEGTGSFNTNQYPNNRYIASSTGNKVGDGEGGIQPKFDTDLNSAFDGQILAKVKAYSHYAAQFQNASNSYRGSSTGIVRDKNGNIRTVTFLNSVIYTGVGDMFEYANNNVPRVKKNKNGSYSVDYGVYASNYQWYYNVRDIFQKMVGTGSALSYSQYIKDHPLALPSGITLPSVNFRLTGMGTNNNAKIKPFPRLDSHWEGGVKIR